MKNRPGKRLLVLITTGLVLWLGLAAGSARAAEVTVSSQEQFAFARELMQEGEYLLAIGELRRFIRFFPEDEDVPRAWYLIGRCRIALGQHQKAASAFSRVFRLDPDPETRQKTLLAVGDVLTKQDRSHDAVGYYKELLKRDLEPEARGRILYRLGWAELREGNWQQASTAFQQVPLKSQYSDTANWLARRSLEGSGLPYKDPVKAGIMASLIPGLGHAYVHRYKDAAMAFAVNALFALAAWESFEEGHEVLGGMLLFLELGWYTGNIYSGVNVTHKHNRRLRGDFLQNLKEQTDLRFGFNSRGGLALSLNLRF
ncbi:MAG: tetratricopeptide repeat protein [Desulfohalobiaceae bacterium]|nr:tetratricopeptide repeat protein [Spirochaetales bacterium]MCF8038785.1 tetratricopeptide repeat protein [Desulfohalobiaceae bacterium]